MAEVNQIVEEIPVIEEKRDLLIEVGAHETVIGFAGDGTYFCKVPSFYTDSNYPLLDNDILSTLKDMAYERVFGEEAVLNQKVLKIFNILKNEDYFTYAAFLKNILESRNIAPAEHRAILILPSDWTLKMKEKLKKALFLLCQFPKIVFVESSICVLIAFGLNTGIIVDIGHFSTRIESIYRGFLNPEGIFQFQFGGYQISKYLVDKILPYISVHAIQPLITIAEDIKREAVFCELNPEVKNIEIQEGSFNFDRTVELPNGKQFTLNKECYECVEQFFHPEIGHISTVSLIDHIENTVRVWDRTQVPELLEHIIICGSTSQIPGLINKIYAGLTPRFSANIKISMHPTLKGEEKDIFWKGGSILYKKREGQFDWMEKEEDT